MPLSDDETTLIAFVDIGLEAEQFMQSDMGLYLRGRALKESDEASAALKNVSPKDEEKIIELQIMAKVAEKALVWIAEAIVEGQQAEVQIHQLEATEDG